MSEDEFGVDREVDEAVNKAVEQAFNKKKVVSMEQYRANQVARRHKQALLKILEEAKKLDW